jgi:hypothetical protein
MSWCPVNVAGANKVFTTCGTDEKVAFLKKLANNDERLHVINYKTQSQSPPTGCLRISRLILDFEEEIKKVTDGVDHVIEFIGKSYWTQNLNVLRRDGVMVYLAFMSGAGFPEDASIAQVRHTFLLTYTVMLAGSWWIATIQEIDIEGKYTSIKGCEVSTEPTREVWGIGITAIEREKDEDWGSWSEHFPGQHPRRETNDRSFPGTRFRMHTRRWRGTRIAERYVAAVRARVVEADHQIVLEVTKWSLTGSEAWAVPMFWGGKRKPD